MLLVQWQGTFTAREKVAEYDYRVDIDREKIKTYRINMLKKYIDRKEESDLEIEYRK